jgi:hypothetical protein
VVAEPKLPDEDVKEGAPFGVVWFGELEHDGDVGLDVHRLENGDGRSRNNVDGAGVGVAGGGSRGGVGVGDVVFK